MNPIVHTSLRFRILPFVIAVSLCCVSGLAVAQNTQSPKPHAAKPQAQKAVKGSDAPEKETPKLPAPPVGRALPFNGPVVRTDSLSNGLRIVYAKVNDVPLVEISVVFHEGISRDPKGRYGLSQVTARAIFRGTEKRERAQIVGELAGFGSTITSATDYEYTQIYARMLARNARQTIDILADLCMNARFGGGRLSRETNEIRQSAAGFDEGSPTLATLETLNHLYGVDHPMTRSLLAEPPDLDAITFDDVIAHYRAFYRPNNATIIVTGSIDMNGIRDLIADRFGAWERAPIPELAQAPLPPTATVTPGVTILEDASRKTAALRIGFRSPDRTAVDFPSLVVLNQILGGGSRSILGRSMRMTSFLGKYSRQGYLMFSGMCKPEQVDTALGYILTVHRWMAGQELTSEMVAFAKEQLLSDFASGFATNKSVQEKLLDAIMSHEPPSEIVSFRERILRVRPEEVRAIAKKVLLDQKPEIVLAGASELMLPALRPRFGKAIEVKRIAPAPERPTPAGNERQQ
jgi:zinc protease